MVVFTFMKTIKPLKSNYEIQFDFLKKRNELLYQGNPDLRLNAYVEEKDTKYITLSISDEICMYEDNNFDLWLDLDIYQAELLAKKLMILVEDRKKYMSDFLNHE